MLMCSGSDTSLYVFSPLYNYLACVTHIFLRYLQNTLIKVK